MTARVVADLIDVVMSVALAQHVCAHCAAQKKRVISARGEWPTSITATAGVRAPYHHLHPLDDGFLSSKMWQCPRLGLQDLPQDRADVPLFVSRAQR